MKRFIRKNNIRHGIAAPFTDGAAGPEGEKLLQLKGLNVVGC
jgi:hypothetical protein